jgi:hypothetical protein
LGGEYRPLSKFFQSIGIIHRLSCTHTHQQQGCVERKHRHIIDTTLALLATSGVPKCFWDEACQTSCYLINGLPTPSLKHISPFHKLFGKPLDYSLKKFGCQCFPNLQPYNTNKFEFRSKACVFMGYSSHHKGYRCFHLETKKYFVSHDVVFHESVFPFAISTSRDISQSANPSTQTEPSLVATTAPISVSFQPRVHVSLRTHGSSLPTLPTADPSVHLDPLVSPLTDTFAGSSTSTSRSSAGQDHSLDPTHPSTHPMVNQAQNNIVKPHQLHDGMVRYPIVRALLTIQDGALAEPACFSNAINILKWRTTMKTKFNALLQNKMWSLVSHTTAKNVVGCKWSSN